MCAESHISATWSWNTVLRRLRLVTASWIFCFLLHSRFWRSSVRPGYMDSKVHTPATVIVWESVTLSNSVQQSSTWEATSYAGTREFPINLQNPVIQHSIHKILAFVPLLRQVSPVHNVPILSVQDQSECYSSTYFFVNALPLCSRLHHCSYTCRRVHVQVTTLLLIQLSPLTCRSSLFGLHIALITRSEPDHNFPCMPETTFHTNAVAQAKLWSCLVR